MSIQAVLSTTSVVSGLLLCGQQGGVSCHHAEVNVDEEKSFRLNGSVDITDGYEEGLVEPGEPRSTAVASDNILDQIRVACVSFDDDDDALFVCSSWSVLTLLIFVYSLVAIVANVIACYKFISTWNRIVHERRLDLQGFVQRRRRLTLKEALGTHVTMDSMICTSCCICLSDFEENELVTACDEGCHTWFHRECLFTWLDHSNDCPCCRIDMLSKKSKGLLTDLMQFMGFYDD